MNKKNKKEYTIKVEKDKGKTIFSISASFDNVWNESAKGKELVKIIDDGNGIRIYPKTVKVSKKNFYIDYGVQHELRLLLNYINKYEKKRRK